MKRKFKISGFTLIELLIVIGIIAVLAAIIFVAVDPARRLAEARNAERWSSVNAILNATLQYTVDNAGSLPATATAIDSIPATVQLIGEDNTTNCTLATPTCTGETVYSAAVSGCYVTGLDTDLVDEYLSSMPLDPSTGDADDTRYFVNRSGNGRITIGACDEETVGGSTPTIQVSR